MNRNSRQTMTLDDEMPWRPMFAGRDDFYDDCGFAFVAEAGEWDIMVGNFMYFFQGGKAHPKSQWLGDGIVINNLVIITPRSARGKGMTDNNFSRNGMNQSDFFDYDELEVSRTDDCVTWSMGGMTYELSPYLWRMHGKTGECEYDVHFTQMDADVVWSYGTREDAVKTGLGGGYVYVDVTGTMTVGGKTYPIDKGTGVHERLVWSQGMDMVSIAGNDDGYGTGFAINMLGGDCQVWGLGVPWDPMFFLTVEGKQIEYLPGQEGKTRNYEKLDFWHDPRSGMVFPSRWRVTLESGEGKLDLELSAMGRAYYPWELKKGYQMMYWHLAVGNGKFTWPDGRVVEIKDELVQHEIVKLMMVHTETMAGPDRTPMW